LEPYTCARNEYSGEARAWLDANENSRICEYNRYPDPLSLAVKQRLAEQRGVATQQIFLGVGSDECIDMAYRVFCTPGVDNVVAIDPTYGMYRVCADINNVEYRSVDLDDGFELNVDALLAATDANTKVIWICSPNNPTGNAFSTDKILEIADRFHGITIVDEAYIDFSPIPSLSTQLAEHPRMIVMQTLSKAWAGAAIRLGIAFASPEIIDIFNKVKYPYNINVLTQREALRLLNDEEHVRNVVAELVEARNMLTAELVMLNTVEHVYRSDANFILVKVADPDGLYAWLRDHAIIVRNRNRVNLCHGCLRITVGSDTENDLLLQALKEYDATRN
jgi:histidinol-phosphate aminotransferase